MRLGYARLNQESNALSPIATTIADFDDFHYLEGRELSRATTRLGAEVSGLSRAAELSGFVEALRGEPVEAVPLVSAWALPGGSMTEDTFVTLKKRLIQKLEENQPLDGVYLALHGAQQARGAVRNPEEAYLQAVRDVIGDRALVASYDLHGLMTAPKVDIPDIVTCYRTNPHRDLYRVGKRSGELLLQTARREIAPTMTWRSLPMVKGGGLTVDFLSPMRRVFSRMKQMERDPAVLYVSLFTVHLWLDSEEPGWAVVVATDNDEAKANRLADELADLAWSVRHDEHPPVMQPKSAIERARKMLWARKLGAIYMVDVSDVVGAGAPGENVALLKAMLDDAHGLTCYVPVRDAVAVHEAWGRISETIELELGGRFDPVELPGLSLRARVVRCRQTENYGRAVLLQAESVFIVVTEKAPLAVRPKFFTDLGLNPLRADIIVAKTFFHFRWFHLAVARRVMGVETKGATDLDAWRRTAITGKVHPRDHLTDWRSEDRRRRGVST